ncbi:MAG: molybdate ABC transporter substrate-binding protein [Lentisphaerae bacterium]|nr:molybdate ABC transporter substrate-binding protein [Lentisphaerota bacterium]MBT4816271.1 molybdate ABC transporter substrate-binding protein [Lentisphaerota bacterium]MBT5608816.1 molybdate ABC transporter substrate-binding protein [Lentisphaerota bacterium]MBT7059976.1 molybdate ABC transporter substrate-binding protein [Lentisphaerota bacterium]MBT7840302.1 molybdate ABC transporter substrate-binding protein [Lentisphaerota bacterium]
MLNRVSAETEELRRDSGGYRNVPGTLGVCLLALAFLSAVLLVGCEQWGSPHMQEGSTPGAQPATASPLGLTASGQSDHLVVFAGAASQPATSEVAHLFEQKTGIRVDCSFGGSGAVLNQIRIESFGDVYIPGSNDYMDIADQDGQTVPRSRRVICYLTPVICVAKGNPQRIDGLRALSRDGLRVTMGDPGSVCLGSIAKQALEREGVYPLVRRNIVTYASDCQQIANLIRLGEVDAAVGYDVFHFQSPKHMDVVPIPRAEQVNIPAAVVTHSKQKERAQEFVAFIAGPDGLKVFAKYGYATTAQQ